MIERISELVASTGLNVEHINLAEDGWVVENPNGELVGYAGIEKREDRVYLQSLAVKKGYRKLGIGSRLVDKAFDSLGEGENLIALTLFWNNDFYRNCGFEKLNAKDVKKKDDVAGREKHKYCVAWGKKK